MLWNVKSKCVQTHKYIIAKGSDHLGVNLRFISLELCFHGQFPPMLHFYFLIYKMGIKMTLTHWNLVGWSLFLYVCFCCCLITQSCPTLCNPMDCSPPGSSVHGISQARLEMEWVAISFSRGSSQLRDQTCVSCTAGRFFTAEPSGKPSRPL